MGQQSPNIAQALFRRLWVIILGLILGGVLGALVSQQTNPIYQSNIYLLVVPVSGDVESLQPPIFEQANDYAQAYSRLVTDPAVVGEAVSESEVGVDPWDIRKVVSVEVTPNAPIIEVTVNSEDPEDASTLANALGSGLSSFTQERDEDTGYRAEVMAEAVPPEDPTLPNWIVNVAVGAAAGLLVAGVIALLWDSLRQTWKTWADQRRERRKERERQLQARREEQERQQREREAAELERTLQRYLELRSSDLQKLRQREGGRYSTGYSPLDKTQDEPQREG